jgi:hypothetical protein
VPALAIGTPAPRGFAAALGGYLWAARGLKIDGEVLSSADEVRAQMVGSTGRAPCGNSPGELLEQRTDLEPGQRRPGKGVFPTL